MRRIGVILVLGSIAAPVAGGPEFIRRYTVEVRGMAQAADGGFVVAGETATLEKIDATGLTSEWMQQYSGSGSLSVRVLLGTRDGGFVLVGVTSTGTGLLKTDPAGAVLWGVEYPVPTTGVAGLSAAEAPGGDLIVAGIGLETPGDGDVWLLRLDSAGALRWFSRYPHSGNETLAALAVSAADQTVVAATSVASAIVFSVDAGGQVGWAHQYQHAGDQKLEGDSVVTSADGGFIVGGARNPSISTWLLKLTSAGDLVWDQSLHAGQGLVRALYSRLVPDASGGAGAFTTGPFSPPGFLHVAADGTLPASYLGYTSLQGSYASLRQAVVASDGGFAFTTEMVGDFGGGKSWFVAKTDAEGRPYGCIESASTQPSSDPVTVTDVTLTRDTSTPSASQLDFQAAAVSTTGVTQCYGTLGCAAPPGAITLLKAVKAPPPLGAVNLTWKSDPTSVWYTTWFVEDKTDIDKARACCQPPAYPIPWSGPTSARDQGSQFQRGFYQVRGNCDPVTEGP